MLRIHRAQRALVVLFAALAAQSVLAADLGRARPESVGMSSERLKRLDDAISAYVDQGRTPGVVTLIARKGKVVHVSAYGTADLATGRRTTDQDLFRMYSMTKPITSVALLMLYEEGKFQLTDPLAKFFPKFADVKVYAGMGPHGMRLDSLQRPITIQDVFRHTAGFSYGFGGSTPIDQLWAKANLLGTDLNGLMEKLPTLPLLHQPGERWVYSVAHDVQAALVEKLSGMKFDDFVRQRIFQPLGMRDAVFAIPADKRSRVPALYTSQEGKLVPAAGGMADGYGETVFGGYSISSTVHDYVRFAQMLLNKGELNGTRLLSPKTVELMATNHLPQSAAGGEVGVGVGPGTGYGLGVSVLLDPAQRGNIGSAGEFGWSGAASTHFLVDPEEELVAIYATQLMGGDFALRAEFVTLVYQAIVD